MDRTMHVARFKAKADTLVEFLGMPEGTSISKIELVDPINMVYEIYVFHKNLWEVPSGGIVPEIFPVMLPKTETPMTPRDILHWDWNLEGKLWEEEE